MRQTDEAWRHQTIVLTINSCSGFSPAIKTSTIKNISTIPPRLHLHTQPGVCQFSHSLTIRTCFTAHLFLSCLQHAARGYPPHLIFPPAFPPSPLASTRRLPSLLLISSAFLLPSLSLTRPQRIPRTARVSPESCQDMFGCQRDAERERIRHWPWCVPDKKQAN